MKNKSINFHISLEFKFQDIWIGCYWKTTDIEMKFDHGNETWKRIDIWICFLPCLPLHFQIDKIPFVEF